MKKSLSFFTFMLLPLFSFSEDIELYIGSTSQLAESKPQILLIVDTSGSMGDKELVKTPYDPNRTYQTLGGFSDTGQNYHYYVVSTSDTLPNVDNINENRRFLASINQCSTAKSRLDEVGFYTGRLREYKFEGNIGSWEELSETDGRSITLIDCEDDITLDLSNLENSEPAQHNQNTVNSEPLTGYPIDGAGDSNNPIYYATDITSVNSTWGGDTVTVYTDNYLRWRQGTQYSDDELIGQESIARMEIARKTIANLIESVPSVQFGLQVFNANAIVNGVGQNLSNAEHDADQTQPHGGRIAFGIQEMTASAKDDLITIVEDEIRAGGSTPLCESFYEAYRYLSGSPVMYGNNDVDINNHRIAPERDQTETTEVDEVYQSPYVGCSNEIFVILITDGVPQRDNAADDEIIALNSSPDAVPIDDNYLPVLAEYMHNNDINATMTGKQIATLYTVGFSSGAADAEELLRASALHGGGLYLDATDANQLGAELQRAISSIIDVSTSFTAPSVATNSFDRTETQDAAYYGMFIPESGAKWKGNLKKLRLEGGQQVDQIGAVAINEDGNIISTAKTFWSEEVDGNNVEAGGVVGMFNNKTSSRKVLSDIGASSGTPLSTLTLESMTTHYQGDTTLISLFGVIDESEAQEYVDWALGVDVDDGDGDGSTTDYRPDLFGDPLHSKPVAINYGGSEENPDIRIVVGTNSGVLHMFKDSGATVDESWAFMPKRFFSDIKPLRDNLPSADKIYGIDGPITSFIFDSDGDGTITGSTTDDDNNVINTNEKAWIFFGLRRGGSSYYALDVTLPDEPKFMWEIKANTGDFSELGQTWSQPQVGYSKLNIGRQGPKPVLIFGAGYSIAKDSPGPGTNDNVGRGIYMVDAETGTLLWSITPGTTSEANKNTQFTGFTDSIPSKISVLDSDSDGFIDRLYTGDTGGNVFRVDMPGAEPFNNVTPWTAFKLAELGGITNSNDRRFFNAPTIVRTFFTNTVETTIDGSTSVISQEIPYDAILIGSGDRSTPTATDTDDKFFMLKDENIITQSFVIGAVAPALEPPLPTIRFNDTDLHNFTGNPYESLSGAAKQNLDLIVSQKSGWYYNYSVGERSTAGALVVNGQAIFTSFVPATDLSSCSLDTGQGFLYAIDLFDGTTSYDTRKLATVTSMPDTPILVIPPIGTVTTTPDENDPPGTERPNILILTGGLPVDTDVSLNTFSTYQYVTEE